MLCYSESIELTPSKQCNKLLLIINNRNFGYFITLLKIKFLVSQLASGKILACLTSIFVLMLAPTETFLRPVLAAAN